ncbi:beta-ketoacyl synthase N-terminal-like domain-containing protein [Flavobacterium aciduliphilum]|uniref:3-oxoacyl-[acyl-carrier-protein] synthase-1 n=1 Tax=Flavobacterium aciduliphilum TaxID=1101402 RepID=A0A328YC27_9FLAO|nr:beta-ketoacyl synthase N-terminal-like domain-containing protein [Flavobacterium aciduliphilum]RAR71528.1 3-oxoacyl-[acyl-carrier-protein] synthase-1 [Flavobacterium aciduliphilum]
MSKNCYIIQTNCVTPLGFDVNSNFEAMLNGDSGIQCHKNSPLLGSSFYAATIDSTQLDVAFSKVECNAEFSRLEKMLILSLQPIISKQKVTPKSVFILSTTKGNITALENKEYPIEGTYLSVLAKKIALYFGFTTEPIVVSNACVSGVLAVAVANRMIQAGVYEEAFLVAGDEVSEFVLSGFNSFQAMSENPCKPYDKDRNGVTLGEATAAVYISSDESKIGKGSIKILGDGSVNDANHISGPSRTGEGLYRSISSALKEAYINPHQIDYLSAHGTATLYNDEMEAIAFSRLGLQNVPINSYKGFFGHTLGASGLLETVFAIECANRNQLIASKGYNENGVSQNINIIHKNAKKEITYFLKTASGFGGCNTAVVFEKIK